MFYDVFFIKIVTKWPDVKHFFIFTNKLKKMKKTVLLAALLLLTGLVFGQKKEKIKGSKIVKVEIKSVPTFETIDVSDDLEIYLIKGVASSVEIDADDNLHEIVDLKTKGKALYISTLKSVSSAKKFILRITYTSDLKQVLLHNQVKASSLTDLDLNTITFKNYDETRLFITSKSINFSLFLDDDARAELNLKGDKTTLNLSKNAQLKALIVSNDLALDQYQKTEAKIEGDCNNLRARLDNSARFTGKNLVAKSAELITELNTKASVNVKTLLKIAASGTSEVEFYGAAKTEITNFADTAILRKMQLK